MLSLRVSRSRSSLEQVGRHRSGVAILKQAVPLPLAWMTGSDAVDDGGPPVAGGPRNSTHNSTVPPIDGLQALRDAPVAVL